MVGAVGVVGGLRGGWLLQVAELATQEDDVGHSGQQAADGGQPGLARVDGERRVVVAGGPARSAGRELQAGAGE